MREIEIREKLVKSLQRALLNENFVSSEALQYAADKTDQYALKWVRLIEVDFRASQQARKLNK